VTGVQTCALPIFHNIPKQYFGSKKCCMSLIDLKQRTKQNKTEEEGNVGRSSWFQSLVGFDLSRRTMMRSIQTARLLVALVLIAFLVNLFWTETDRRLRTLYGGTQLIESESNVETRQTTARMLIAAASLRTLLLYPNNAQVAIF